MHGFTHRPALVSLAAWLSLFPISAGAQAQPDVSKDRARPVAPWVRDGVIYELFPRQFSATGDFKGVTAGLDRLQKLGVTILWLMPVNPTGEAMKKGTVGSPYAIRDYYDVNPAYGSKDDLKRLVREAHARGIKVILDVVINHSSWDNKLLAKPAYYLRDAKGRPIAPYDWTDVAGFDYRNADLRQYMSDMLAWWIREFDVDGFRCDVAWNIPRDFWDDTRAKLDAVKPDIVMLAEAEQPPLLVKAFELDYAWAVYHAMAAVFQEGRPASFIREAWEHERRSYPVGATHMRISDDHDEKRAIARFGERGALAASAFVFLIDGVPLLYNGMEVGDVTESTAPALFEKLPVFWDIGTRRPEFAKFYEGIIPLRRDHSALRRGETTWIGSSDDARVLTFVRRDATEEILVAINFSNRPFSGTVEAAGSFTEITPGTSRDASPALPALSLDAWGWRVFRRTR